MKVLVTAASRHGSTREIANEIVEELRTAGLDVAWSETHDVASLDGYDALIIGSAVYLGGWMPEARQLVDQFQPRLAELPVWLFSSGPLGAYDPKPTGDPSQLPALIEKTHARGHCIFTGRLDRAALNLGERLIVRMVHAPEGDFRDWNAIHDWAREIARELEPSQTGTDEALIATARRT